MIRNRLNVLLAERNLTIKDVNKKTGLSRTTISNMINGISDGLQLSTLDVLCNYLEITPNDFFEYAPYIIDFNILDDSPKQLFVSVKNGENHKSYFYQLFVSQNDFGRDNQRIETYDLYINYESEEYNDLFKSEIYDLLPVRLKNDIKVEILDTLVLHTSTLIESIANELNLPKKSLNVLLETPFSSKTQVFHLD